MQKLLSVYYQCCYKGHWRELNEVLNFKIANPSNEKGLLNKCVKGAHQRRLTSNTVDLAVNALYQARILHKTYIDFEKVMKIIRTQDFNEGNWNENDETKKIKIKYKNEYDLLKGLKNQNINDNVAITIIIIYFIYKEYSELLSELSRIIKKAKNFIKKETSKSYEDIIKQIGIK